MLEIDKKQKLKPSEGAHFFFTLIFLVACYLLKHKMPEIPCDQNLSLFCNVLYYSLIIWITFLFITMIARCKNRAIKWFFIFMDTSFGIFIFGMLFWGVSIYTKENTNCLINAPAHLFFVKCFLIVTIVVFVIVFFATIAWIFRKFSKVDEQELIYDNQLIE